jgi:ferredoxin
MSRLLIDWTRCDGHGLCARLLPEAISLDEWGFPIIEPVDADPTTARMAVVNCPRMALRMEK